MSVKSKLEEISPEDRKRLLYAFNGKFCQVVILDDNTFIGVHCGYVTNIIIEEQQGAWATGTIK